MPKVNVESAGAAFARQAAMEARVERALLASMREFLDDVYRMAVAEGMQISPAAVAAAWSERTSVAALGARLPAAVSEYVSASVAMSDVPDEAYTSTMAVLQQGADADWSAEDTRGYLLAALSLETGATFLTAAAPTIKRDADGKPIYRRTAGLDSGGMSWAAAVKRDARTAVTGLDGLLSTAAMAEQGKPYKRWVTRQDARVRETHAAAQGQTVPVGEPFSVGGADLQYPGDSSGPAREVVNCRCVTVASDRLVKGTTALPFLPG